MTNFLRHHWQSSSLVFQPETKMKPVLIKISQRSHFLTFPKHSGFHCDLLLLTLCICQAFNILSNTSRQQSTVDEKKWNLLEIFSWFFKIALNTRLMLSHKATDIISTMVQTISILCEGKTVWMWTIDGILLGLELCIATLEIAVNYTKYYWYSFEIILLFQLFLNYLLGIFCEVSFQDIHEHTLSLKMRCYCLP